MTTQKIVKILRSSDFNYTEEGGNGEALSQKGLLVIRDYWFYGGDEKLSKMVEDWTDGIYSNYFQDKYGVTFELVESRSHVRGGRMFGKKQSEGVNEIKLKVLS